ncbi:MAG: hypothetical protein KAU03_00610, partial [Candidatus Altiarchaeales archaeon]|nr:hypothetical protein [Candidatus Altiarchaeales archaeon]
MVDGISGAAVVVSSENRVVVAVVSTAAEVVVEGPPPGTEIREEVVAVEVIEVVTLPPHTSDKSR